MPGSPLTLQHRPNVPLNSRLLTLREEEIADLVAEGLSNRDIGTSLFISDSTVKAHICSILQKTGMGSKLELAVQRLTRKHERELESLRSLAA